MSTKSPVKQTFCMNSQPVGPKCAHFSSKGVNTIFWNVVLEYNKYSYCMAIYDLNFKTTNLWIYHEHGKLKTKAVNSALFYFFIFITRC